MSGNNHINPVIPNYLPEDVKMVGGVERIVEQRAFEREQGRFFNPKAGRPALPPAYVEMGNVNLMVPCKLLEDIVVPRRNGVVKVILGGDKKDLHGLRIPVRFRVV
jgi:hypothetical protein